jgi:hypothetical protein
MNNAQTGVKDLVERLKETDYTKHKTVKLIASVLPF